MNAHDTDPQPRYDITNENRYDLRMLSHLFEMLVLQFLLSDRQNIISVAA